MYSKIFILTGKSISYTHNSHSYLNLNLLRAVNKQYYQLGLEKIEVWKILTHQPSIDNCSHSSANKTFPCFLWRQLNSKTLKFNLTTKRHRSSKFNSTNWIADFAYKSGSPHNPLKTLMSVAQFLLPLWWNASPWQVFTSLQCKNNWPVPI